jgi:hypothetical protein
VSNGWKSHLPVAAGFAAGLLAVGAAAAKSAEAEAEARRKRKRLSDAETYTLVALMFVAIIVSIVLAIKAGAMWPLLPFVVWFFIFSALRDRAKSGPQRKSGKKHAQVMRDTEVRDREAERQWLLERERIDEFGEEGVRLIARANDAVERILATEAAREGWLGKLDDLDFSADQSMITENLKQVSAFRLVIAELVAIPNRTVDDDRLRKDAAQAVGLLEAAVRQRVRMLLGCAHEAEEVDRILERERKEAHIAEKRDDVRSRLAAMVYGVELASTDRDSESADAVNARVAAFRELKGGIEIPPRNEEVVREDSNVVEVQAVESNAQQQPKKLAKKAIQGNVITARVIVHRIKQLLLR